MNGVTQQPDDNWAARLDGKVLVSGVSHREAWRAYDKARGEALSRAEETTEWLARMSNDD